MAIFDPIKDFFLKKILLPRVFQINIPGYVIGKFYTLEGQSAFVRNFFLPESFFLKLEAIVNKKLGRNGLEQLYGVGKRFGYRFSLLNKISRTNIVSSTEITFKFFETLYAEKLLSHINLDQRRLELETTGLVVTHVAGGGLPLTIGGCAGIWGFLLDDFEGIECGVVKKAEGAYNLVSGPGELLKREGVSFFTCSVKPTTLDEEYRRLNQPPKLIPPDAFNMNRLMETRLFEYRRGELKFALPGERFVPVELSLPFELEFLFGDKMIFEATKDSFAQVGKAIPTQPNPFLFLANMLTAFGYGLVNVEKKANVITLHFQGYPWYAGCEKSSLPVVRGIMLGFLEGHLQKKITLEPIASRVSSGQFLVSLGVRS